MSLILLTDRQREVIFLVAQGLTAAEIGAALEIASSTAAAHIETLRAKFGVSKRQLPAAYWKLTGENPWPQQPTDSFDYVALSS